jgi:hypothetical protein
MCNEGRRGQRRRNDMRKRRRSVGNIHREHRKNVFSIQGAY